METLLIEKSDFACIGQVAEHCDWDQLCIYIREQQNLSLLPKIGQCLYAKLYDYLNNEEGAENLDALWNGGKYTGCNGSESVHFGLKRMLVHYAYGAYIYRHGYVDSPFGVVQKVHQDSIPAPLKELKSLNLEHRNNAEYYWGMTKDYICSMSKESPFDDCYSCGSCSCRCGHCSGNKRTLQNRGMRFKNIEK